MTQYSAPKASAASFGKAEKPTVKSLIAQLASDDGTVRIKARRQLVVWKAWAVAPLVRTLSDEHHWVRWEAAKALSLIGNAESIQRDRLYFDRRRAGVLRLQRLHQ